MMYSRDIQSLLPGYSHRAVGLVDIESSLQEQKGRSIITMASRVGRNAAVSHPSVQQRKVYCHDRVSWGITTC